MAESNHYFKLGAFITSGVGLLAAALIILGSSALFEKTIPAETYFNESVQGLDIGSPVKYRGVSIGRVGHIGFVFNKYDTDDVANRLVLVEMELYDDLFVPGTKGRVRQVMNEVVEQGLRVRLTTKGLTGVAFLEMNFYDPRKNPVLEVPWRPKSIYIPSAPSTMSRIEEAVSSISNVMNSLRDVDFAELADTVSEIAWRINEALARAHVDEFGELIVQSTAELRDLLRRAGSILEDPKLETVIPDTSAAAAGLRRIVENGEEDILLTVKSLRTATGSLAESAGALENMINSSELPEGADVAGMMTDLKSATRDIRESAVRLNRLMTQLNELLLSNRADIDSILYDAKIFLDNLNELSEDAKRNPSRLFFGEPPAPTDPAEAPDVPGSVKEEPQ